MLVTSNSDGTSAKMDGYWDFGRKALEDSALQPTSGDGVVGRLRSLLDETVEQHLVADVPVGVFLSSGIDSTALVALASKMAEGRDPAAVHTLTVSFPEQEYSEAELARRTAKRFGTTHRELLLRGEDMLARLDEAVAALDQPSMDGINTYFVSWAARQAGLKVALSGLGSDEIFGGYSTFRHAPRAKRLAAVGRQVPAGLRLVTAAALERAGLGEARSDARRKLLALWRDPDVLPHPYFYTRLLFAPEQVAQLLNGSQG